jgi:hypothetical protein
LSFEPEPIAEALGRVSPTACYEHDSNTNRMALRPEVN